MASESDGKRAVVQGIVLASLGILAVNRHFNSSARVSLKTRLGWNDLVTKHFSFNKGQRFYTAITYSLNHHTWRHMAFNTALIYVLGNQMIQSSNYSLPGLIGLTGVSAAATAAAEAPLLKPGSPLIGASGIAMGFLASLAATDPDKLWLMIIPMPGVPITTLQLFEASVAGHIFALMWTGLSTSTRVALRGHLAGLTVGYIFSRFAFSYGENYKMLENSRKQWLRSITSAELVLYWMYLSVRLLLPMPFATEAEKGEMRTKQRFIRRTWKEDF